MSEKPVFSFSRLFLIRGQYSILFENFHYFPNRARRFIHCSWWIWNDLLIGDLMTITPFNCAAEFCDDYRHGFLGFRMNIVK